MAVGYATGLRDVARATLVMVGCRCGVWLYVMRPG